jgi:hypothetical protein
MTSSSIARRVAATDGITKHLDAFNDVPAFKQFAGNQRIPNNVFETFLSTLPEDVLFSILKQLPDDSLVDILKKLNTSDVAKIIKELPDVDFRRIVEKLPDGMVNSLRDMEGLSRRINDVRPVATIDIDIGDIATSTPPSGGWPKATIDGWVKQFDEMTPEERTLFTSGFRGSTNSTTLPDSFNRLPTALQRKMIASDPVIRWRAGNTLGAFDYVRGACKSLPVGCAIGSIGGMVGLGYATVEMSDRIKDLYDKSDEERACIATCLPNDWYSSEASGSGTLDYDELDFKDLEELKETTGNNDLTAANTPLCNVNMTPEGCINMCESRCEDLNSTFLQDLAEAAGDIAGDAAGAAGDAAGEGLAAFLDGIFGEGMGIPAAIAIFIFIVIVMMVVM